VIEIFLLHFFQIIIMKMNLEESWGSSCSSFHLLITVC